MVVAGLLILIAAHLTLGAIEVLHRPVFPWDAWLNWMYRAKAWYLSGHISDFDPVTLWASGAERQHTYAVAGHHYPRLLPLIAYGVATAFGFWNESLINAPFLICALLLPLVTYWVMRELRHTKLAAILCAYFVTSVPLIGAHLSLAGQADIWLACTTGLGFSVIFLGLSNQHFSKVAIGLVAVALGTQLKVEGAVWLLTAFFFIALGYRPRLSLLGLFAALLAGVLMYSAGIETVDIPRLGKLGLDSNRLYVPLLGSYALQTYELGDDYLSNFFIGGSWNLLWYLTLFAILVALLRVRTERVSALALSFFACVTAGQVLIFFFTEQGAWAEDWTAINRLPLHFVPALVVVSITVSLSPPSRTGQDVSTKVGGYTLAFGLGALMLMLVFSSFLGPSRDSAHLHRYGSELRTVAGLSEAIGATRNIVRFENNVALVTTGPISVRADSAQIVRVETKGTNKQNTTLFWRTNANDQLYSESLPGGDAQYIDLRDSKDWTGDITEVGLVFYDDGGSVQVDALSLHAPDLGIWVSKALADWSSVEPWSQRSVHWIPGSSDDSGLPLNAALLILVALVAAGALRKMPIQQRRAGLISIFAAVWILSDLNWLHQRYTLARKTASTYSIADSGPLDFGDDAIGRRAIRRALCDRVDDWQKPAKTLPEQPLVIAGNSDRDMRFQILRAKYHALPVPSHAHEREFRLVPTNLADRVLVLKLRYGIDSAEIVSSSDAREMLAKKTGQTVHLAWEDSDAFMLILGQVPVPNSCWNSEA